MALAGPNVRTAHHIPLALFSAPLERRIIHHYPSIESILDQHVAACALLIVTLEWIVERKAKTDRDQGRCKSYTIFELETKACNHHAAAISKIWPELISTTK